jgi:hypothetical protein
MNAKTNEIVEALRDLLLSVDSHDDNLGPANVADVLAHVGFSLADIAKALRALSNADASTPMGAIEAFGAVVEESADKLAGALHAIAEAISDPNRKD